MTLPIHVDFERSTAPTPAVSKDTVTQVKELVENELHGKVQEVLENTENWINRTDLFEVLNLTNQSTNRKRYLDPLLEINWLQLKFPENTTHPLQGYKITPAGERILFLLNPKDEQVRT